MEEAYYKTSDTDTEIHPRAEINPECGIEKTRDKRKRVIRCFVLVEINSPVEKRSSQKENIDSECDFPHQMASNFSYVASHSESSSKLSTQNSEEPKKIMQNQ